MVDWQSIDWLAVRDLPGILPTQQRRSQETTVALLEAAAAMLRERSLDELSIEDLCRRVGVTIGAFYGRFESKDAFFSALMSLAARKALAPTGDLVGRAAAADRFTGKSGSSLDIVAPAGLPVARLAILGVGKAGKLKAQDLVKLGGAAMGKVPARAEEVAIFAEFASGALKPDQAAEIALGTQLRAYVFDRYKTKRREGEEAPAKPQITIAVSNAINGNISHDNNKNE